MDNKNLSEKKDKTDFIALFIVGSGKSGTTLLQALFDNHPNLVVFPIETCFYQNYPKINKTYEEINIQNPLAAQNYFLNYWTNQSKFSWLKDGVYTKHPNEKLRDFTNFDFKSFVSCLYKYNFKYHSRVLFYKHLLKSYYYSLKQKTHSIRGFVDKTPIHMFSIDTIREDFPNAKIIHMLRDPFDNYFAYRSNALKIDPGKSLDLLLPQFVDRLILPSFEIAKNNISNSYQIVKYEDLVH